MATVQIMQGDSRAIFINFTVNGTVLTPDMIDDLEVHVGEDLRLSYTDGGVKHDQGRWYIWPTQEQTFAMEEGSHKVQVRVKFHNQSIDNVKGYDLDDKIKVKAATSREVL